MAVTLLYCLPCGRESLIGGTALGQASGAWGLGACGSDDVRLRAQAPGSQALSALPDLAVAHAALGPDDAADLHEALDLALERLLGVRGARPPEEPRRHHPA